MATTTDRIFDKLDQVTEGIAEVKREQIATTLQIETLANHQREANHRTQKAEERIASLEEINIENEKRDAYASGVRKGAAGVFLSKKQFWAILSALPVVVAVVEAAARLWL